jgi:xylulose-5-phosphate/fructose-6-phosphate phosphoketolase
MANPAGLADDELRAVDAAWRAANDVTVGQIYLLDNPLLREPPRAEHIKPRPFGHWGTSPGLSLVWARMNRPIHQRHLNAIYGTGPGHGGPVIIAKTWFEGSYTDATGQPARTTPSCASRTRSTTTPASTPSTTSRRCPTFSRSGRPGRRHVAELAPRDDGLLDRRLRHWPA